MITLLVIVACAILILYLYRREGTAPLGYKMLLAALRISLVVLAVFMLSEAVLSVERTGLPYFVVMAAPEGLTTHHRPPKPLTPCPVVSPGALSLKK